MTVQELISKLALLPNSRAEVRFVIDDHSFGIAEVRDILPGTTAYLLSDEEDEDAFPGRAGE